MALDADVFKDGPEDLLYKQIQMAGLPLPERWYQFCPNRKWKSDFAWLYHPKLIVEVEGGTWQGGRHTTGTGFEADCLKYLAAMEHGFVVLRFTSGMVRSGVAIAAISRFLQRGDSAWAATNPCHPITRKVSRTTRAARTKTTRENRRRKVKH